MRYVVTYISSTLGPSISVDMSLITDKLLENIAFLIRHNQTTFGKYIEPNDVNLASRNWQVMQSRGSGFAGVSVFVNGGTGFTHTVIRVHVGPGQSVVDCLTAQVDKTLREFFPGI
jgi:hypothetical protein